MDKRSLQAFRENLLLNGVTDSKYRGIVEDVRDPIHAGRVRVRVYAIHGDYNKVATHNLPWAQPCFPNRGAYTVPELFDRVWVSFENGNVETPIWEGFWCATPDGTGTLPFNRRQGLETPRETWFFHPDNYPTTMSVFRTGEGDQMWVEDAPLGDNHYSRVCVQDAGGRSFRISSVQAGTDYRPSGSDIKGRWGAETQYRKSESRNTSASKGGVSLESSDFKLTSVNAEGDSYSELRQSGSAVSFVGGDRVRIHSGNGTDAYRSVIRPGQSVLHTNGTHMVNSATLQLPEVW